MKIKVGALTKISATSHHHSLGQCQIYPDYVCWNHPWEQWVNSDCRSKFCCYFRWIVSSLKQLHNYIIHEKNLHKPFSMMTKWPYLFLIWTLEALSYWYWKIWIIPDSKHTSYLYFGSQVSLFSYVRTKVILLFKISPKKTNLYVNLLGIIVIIVCQKMSNYIE